MKLVCLLLFVNFLSFGQTIEGTITDSETKEPIENVSIRLMGQNDYSNSDEEGHFLLRTKHQLKNSDSLLFSLLGYQDHKLSINDFRKANHRVTLQKRFEDLNEVEIISKKDLQKKLQFTELAPMPEGVFDFASTASSGKIYVAGGNKNYIENGEKKALDVVASNAQATLSDLLKEATRPQVNTIDYSNKLQIYDIESDRWSVHDQTLRKRAFHAAAIYQNKLYVMGGKLFARNQSKEYLDNKIEMIDLDQNEVVIDDTFPHQALNASVFSFNDNIIVMGGAIKKNSSNVQFFTDESHIYNISSGLWYQLPDMTSEKQSNGLLVGGTIYFIGGYDRHPIKQIQSYDIAAGTWSHVGQLFERTNQLALAHHSGIIYMFSKDQLLSFDLNTKTLNHYRIDLNISSSALYAHKDHLIIVGGCLENTFSQTPSSGVYKIMLNQFRKTEVYKTKQL